MSLDIMPLTYRQACAFVEQYHRYPNIEYVAWGSNTALLSVCRYADRDVDAALRTALELLTEWRVTA